jgi:chemotaxis signal transduction protein
VRSAERSEGAAGRTSGEVLRPGEELVTVRAAGWRLLVPLRHVERVLSAAMPAARPSAAAAAPVVAVGDELVPVVFAGALLGEREVRLAAEQQMVLLGGGGRRVLLWVDAVEDVVAHAPAAPPGGPAPADLVLAWSGAERPLAVLDVPRVLAIAR